MATTLGETALAVTAQFGVVALPPTCANDVAGPELICATGDEATSVRVAAYVPALARTAATTAIAPISASLRGLPD
jgi:hypothetical protein